MRAFWILTAVIGLGACVVPYYGDQATPDAGTPDDEGATETDTPAPSDDPEPTGAEPAVDSSPFDTGDGPVTVQTVDGTQPADTCNGAMQMPPLASGYFTGSMQGFDGAGLDPSCFTWSTNGADGYFKVVIPAEATLDVSFEALGTDSQVYLLSDCHDGNTCLAGSDASLDAMEGFSFTNPTATEQTAYLVVAVYNPNTPPDAYDLSVQVTTP